MTMSEVDFEPYPDELGRIAAAFEKIQTEFEFTPLTETNRRLFEMAVATELGEAGFLTAVKWQEVYKNDTPTGVFIPTVQLTGRNRREQETDHDRIRFGVVKGLADGQPGYVREDGQRREDPLRKNIY
jgi:hypothetical protein